MQIHTRQETFPFFRRKSDMSRVQKILWWKRRRRGLEILLCCVVRLSKSPLRPFWRHFFLGLTKETAFSKPPFLCTTGSAVLPAWLTRKFRLESRTYCLLPHWNIETKSWPKKPESKKRLLLVFYTAQRIEALQRKLTGSLKPSVTSIHVHSVQTNEKSLLSEIPILSAFNSMESKYRAKRALKTDFCDTHKELVVWNTKISPRQFFTLAHVW